MTTNFGYRNHDATVTHRLELRRRLIREGLEGPRARAFSRTFRRRFARSLGAVGGMFGLVVTLVRGSIGALAPTYDEAITAEFFFLSLLAFPVGYALGWAIAPAVERRALRRACAADDDPVAALEALRHATGETITAGVARSWEIAGLALPLIATALLGPLTLHAPFFLGTLRPAQEFGQWILLSAVIVGHAHLAFGYFAYRHVRRLTQGERLGARSALAIWGKTILVSAVPGVLLAGIPPIITAVTGVFLVGPMLYWAHRTQEAERAPATRSTSTVRRTHDALRASRGSRSPSPR